MIKYVKKCLKDKRMIIKYFLKSPLSNFLSDKAFLSLAYRANLGKKLNLENPVTFNEKLQWLKVYDKNPEYHKLVDKYEVRKYIEEKLGSEYLIPLLGVYDSFEEIDFDALPNEFVLKPTHTSGNVFICRNKADIDMQKLKKEVNGWLRRDYYSQNREWVYKNLKRRIIAEKLMVDESGYELKDYKFFTFDDEVKAMFIATDRNAETDTCFDFYDRDFNHLPFTNGHPNSQKSLSKPESYDKMVELAEALGKGFPHLRVDFYSINGNIYFGELTFFHWSGFVPFEPKEWDYTMGSWIKLPDKNNAKEA